MFLKKRQHLLLSIASLTAALVVDIDHILTSNKTEGHGITNWHMMGAVVSILPILLARSALIYVYYDCKEDEGIVADLFVALSQSMIVMDIVFCFTVALVPLADLADAFLFTLSDMVMFWSFVYLVLFIPTTLVIHTIRRFIRNHNNNPYAGYGATAIQYHNSWGDGN